MDTTEKIEKAYKQYALDMDENRKNSYKSYFPRLFKKADTDKIRIDSQTHVKNAFVMIFP
jgi:hypothetical protein